MASETRSMTGTVTGGTAAAAPRLRAAIGAAASRTGADFDYLLAQAKSESGLDPTAHAANSSAAGLYQILDQTWLGMLRRHGAEHGLGWAAEAIADRPGGGLSVPDASLRQAVMGLREQPEASALMAGAYAADNARGLEQALGRATTPTDLYMAHFLGLAGATRFLQLAAATPDAPAASAFPQEASANASIFFDAGRPRSFAEVQGEMGRRLAVSAVPAGDAVAEPSAPARPATMAERFAAADAAFSAARDTATRTSAWYDTASVLNAGQAGAAPLPARAANAYAAASRAG